MFLINKKNNKLIKPDEKTDFKFHKKDFYVKGKSCENVINFGVFEEYYLEIDGYSKDLEHSIEDFLCEVGLANINKVLVSFLKDISKINRKKFSEKFGSEFLEDLDNEEVEIFINVEFVEVIGVINSVTDLLKYITNKQEGQFLTELKKNIVDELSIKWKPGTGEMLYIGINKKVDTGLSDDVYLFEEFSELDKDASEIIVLTESKAVEKILKEYNEEVIV